MNLGILILLLLPLAIIAGILFAIWKFTHLILERRGVKNAKLIATLVCILALALTVFWLDSSLAGTRPFGC